MDDEDFEPTAPPSLTVLANESLDALSLDELESRVARLEVEIASARSAIDAKRQSLSDADSFFRN